MTTLQITHAASVQPERGRRAELLVLGAMILAFNLPMLLGGSSAPLALDLGAVRAGAWWRLATCSFVHVSWYHLLLDAGAFLFLYGSLPTVRRGERVLLTAAAAMGSLLSVCLLSPLAAQFGFCGLSGIDHGLMAVSSLEVLARPTKGARSRAEIASLAGLAGKCVWESVTGHPVLTPWHLGSLGTPIVISHAGGLVGAVLAWAALRGCIPLTSPAATR